MGSIMAYINNQMIEKYNEKLKQERFKIAKIIILIAIASLITSVVLFLFNLEYNNKALVILWIFFSAHFVVLMIVAFFIGKHFTSEKPLYQFILPKMIEDIEYDESMIIKYQPYPKVKEIFRKSKLFTKYSTNTTRCQLEYDLGQHQFTILDTYYFTQTNNTYEVHFNGFYVVVSHVNAKQIQVRSKGRPKRSKGVFTKTVNEKKYKVYCQDISAQSNERIISVYDKLKKKLKPKELFVSVIDHHLYIAIDIHKPMRKIKTLNYESYQQVKGKWTDLLLTIKESITQNIDDEII
jgi:hypothetical protein